MEKLVGLLYILLGLLLVIYPIFSSALISVVIGITLICFGLSALSMGFVFTETPMYTYLSLTIGFISLVFGLIFLFFLNALPFLVSFQFYIIGFLMIFYCILGIIFLKDKKYTILSVIGLILGILIVALAVFAATQPVLVAIIVGVFLIIDGVILLVWGKSVELIEQYG